MATNNAINLREAGIVSYDGAGTFSGLANPLTVPNGGSSASSFTAYRTLCGGTTSTGAIQVVSGIGSAGQALTSNGAGALPTYQSLSNSQSINFFRCITTSWNPADSTTRYLSYNGSIVTTNNVTATKIYVPTACTITKVYGTVTVAGTLGSSQNVSIYIRVNNTTDTAITTTSQWTANPTLFSNTGLSLALSAGDFFEIKIVTPAWTTNPTSVLLNVNIYGN